MKSGAGNEKSDGGASPRIPRCFIRATRSGMRATGAFDPGCALETAAVAHYSDRQNLQPYHALMIEFAASAVARIP